MDDLEISCRNHGKLPVKLSNVVKQSSILLAYDFIGILASYNLGNLGMKSARNKKQQAATTEPFSTLVRAQSRDIQGCSNRLIGEKVNQQDFGVHVSNLCTEDHCDDQRSPTSKTCSEMTI